MKDMAHFAQLDENNIVTNVIVVSNSDCLDLNGNESESVGIEFCKKLLGEDTCWIQTSYNNKFRKHYAGIGYTYDKDRDAFIPPKPYESWILIEETCQWAPPFPEPNDGKHYYWDESVKNWVLESEENSA
jgi:hypothetical protein